MNILDAQDAPITWGGHTFPVWSTADLLPVLSRLRAQRVEVLKKYMIELKLPAREAAYALYREETGNLDPFDAHNYFLSAEGVDECLVGSLVRTGKSKEEATKIVNSISKTQIKQELAVRVAAIVEPKEVPMPMGDPAGPPPLASKVNEGLGLGDHGQKIQQELPVLGGALKNPQAA